MNELDIVWDICQHFHAMNDFGFNNTGMGNQKYSRSFTYNAECYSLRENKPCVRNGKCVIARDINRNPINKNS
jgi:hypothetical protein